MCGTLWYMGPEVYEKDTSMKSDVWALGISIIEMGDGKNPFVGCPMASVMQRIVNDPPPTLSSSGWSADMCDFVKECLIHDVEERASVAELMDVCVVLFAYP